MVLSKEIESIIDNLSLEESYDFDDSSEFMGYIEDVTVGITLDEDKAYFFCETCYEDCDGKVLTLQKQLTMINIRMCLYDKYGSELCDDYEDGMGCHFFAERVGLNIEIKNLDTNKIKDFFSYIEHIDIFSLTKNVELLKNKEIRELYAADIKEIEKEINSVIESIYLALKIRNDNFAFECKLPKIHHLFYGETFTEGERLNTFYTGEDLIMLKSKVNGLIILSNDVNSFVESVNFFYGDDYIEEPDIYLIGNNVIVKCGVFVAEFEKIKQSFENCIISERNKITGKLRNIQLVTPRELYNLNYDLYSITPDYFEDLSCDFLRHIGFENIQKIGKTTSSDDGADIEAFKGETKWIFQCKRTKKQIPNEELNSIRYSMEIHKAKGYGLFFAGIFTYSTIKKLNIEGKKENIEIMKTDKSSFDNFLYENPKYVLKYEIKSINS